MYYVYEIIDHRNNLPMYVGKGSGDRKDKHVQKVRLGMVSENRYKDKVIRDIYKETGRYPDSVIVAEFENEDDAYTFETSLIEEYGVYKEGGLLTNILKENKPPNHAGRKRSDETRAKLADRCGEKNPTWGRKHSDEWKQAASERNKGKNNRYYGKTGAEHSCSKIWKIVDPNGKEHIVDNLLEFSKQYNNKYNIKPRTMYEQIRTNKRGWKCHSM